MHRPINQGAQPWLVCLLVALLLLQVHARILGSITPSQPRRTEYSTIPMSNNSPNLVNLMITGCSGLWQYHVSSLAALSGTTVVCIINCMKLYDAAESHSYKQGRQLWAPGNGSLSKKPTCEHTESATSTKPQLTTHAYRCYLRVTCFVKTRDVYSPLTFEVEVEVNILEFFNFG